MHVPDIVQGALRATDIMPFYDKYPLLKYTSFTRGLTNALWMDIQITEADFCYCEHIYTTCSVFFQFIVTKRLAYRAMHDGKVLPVIVCTCQMNVQKRSFYVLSKHS